MISVTCMLLAASALVEYTNQTVCDCLGLIQNELTLRKYPDYIRILDQHASLMLPVYLAKLKSPDTDWRLKNDIFREVSRLHHHDRGDFLVIAHEHLNTANCRTAIWLLADIGSEYDTAPLHMLLMDESDIIRIEACETIGKIGGKKDVVALNLWLRSGHWHDDKVHKERVQKMRDELAARLKKEEDYRNSKPDPSTLKAKPFK